jgi:hypothetical protein
MKNILLIASMFLLTACGTNTIVSNPLIQQRPIFTVPTLTATQQLPIEWYIITRENSETKLREIEQRHGSVTLFATSAQGYQNLSLNVAELRRYIVQQNAIIAALREYYESPQRQNNVSKPETPN